MLLTNLKGNVLQLEGRISNQILEELLIFFTGISGEIYVPKAFLLVWKVLIKALNNGFQQYSFNNTFSNIILIILLIYAEH